ncbi:Plastid-lipid associated protein PAP / fibrillin family protein [Theobroma cacao]|uniref:Plastid-lipid associated protein PAP / fibrillin family protein n=1 Tax=Theobroma cacao TaxID=3641 RepID=A0A061GG32_THECC|nr:Plastid-lipid associated protein PAP / fibrillin family protein [Theobroma cacao]
MQSALTKLLNSIRTPIPSQPHTLFVGFVLERKESTHPRVKNMDRRDIKSRIKWSLSFVFDSCLVIALVFFHLENPKKTMATVSQLNQFPCKTFLSTPRSRNLASKPSILPQNSTKPTQNLIKKSQFFTLKAVRERPVFQVRAVYDDEYGPDKAEEEEEEQPVTESPAVAVAEEEKPKEVSEVDSLKKALVDSFYGTNRGLKATSETRAEIVELITQLEAKNPTPAPTEALTLLNGKWILAVKLPVSSLLVFCLDVAIKYTSFPGLFPLLSRGQLPLVKVEEISQTIDAESFTVQNSVQFSGPLASNTISTNAKFEVRSPKRVQIKFQEGIIGTPQLTDSIVLPENVEFLGQRFDLTPVKGLLTSVQDTASSVAKTISSQPPLKFSLSNSNAESWLLTTYLDEELRISRGDAGSVFVLIKEGSALLTP